MKLFSPSAIIYIILSLHLPLTNMPFSSLRTRRFSLCVMISFSEGKNQSFFKEQVTMRAHGLYLCYNTCAHFPFVFGIYSTVNISAFLMLKICLPVCHHAHVRITDLTVAWSCTFYMTQMSLFNRDSPYPPVNCSHQISVLLPCLGGGQNWALLWQPSSSWWPSSEVHEMLLMVGFASKSYQASHLSKNLL